jgi:hypothetical protein
MRIPHYWAKGEFFGVDSYGDPLKFVAWGWSDQSEAEAKIAGIERARKAFLAQSKRGYRSRAHEYDQYLDLPLREEVIERLHDATGEYAVITRNNYGARILNTAEVMFADIDFQDTRKQLSFSQRMKMCFSPRYRADTEKEMHHRIVDHILRWSERNPQYAFRLYQTRAGYRLLFTNRLFQPCSDEVKSIFNELHTDPLYQLLTRKQESFRARLSPKPWRMGLKDYNTATSKTAGPYAPAKWVRNYEQTSVDYQTCRFIDGFGSASKIPDSIQHLVQLHDEATGVGSDRPLA